jgi:hypothetical protein
MTPVIRIDSEVMNKLKTKAKEFDLVFEPPNSTLRVLLGLDKKMSDRRQRFGERHEATPVRDKTTGKVYSSKYRAGLEFKREFPNIDEKYLWYQVVRKYPRRFIEVENDNIC